jgi:hypothetical protein
VARGDFLQKRCILEAQLKSQHADSDGDRDQLEQAAASAERPNLDDPRIVLSLLESDQVVAAKRRTHFGQKKLSFGVRILLWSLRVYVVIMLVLALISVLRALHVVN